MKTYSDYGSSHGPSATRDSHASSGMSHMSSDGDRFGPPVKAPSSGPGNSGRPVPRNPSGDYNAKVYADRNKAAAATQSPEEEESSRREGAGFVRTNEGIMGAQPFKDMGVYDDNGKSVTPSLGPTPSMAEPTKRVDK